MKSHHFPTGAQARAEHVQVRANPLLRCMCGRIVRVYDFDCTDGSITLDCHRLLELVGRN